MRHSYLTTISQAIGKEGLEVRDRAFLGASTLLFLASAATTIYWCSPMSGGMPMPGGWTMSMAWMRMPGQSLLGATASFTGIVMMIAMMLPSPLPMLSIYRRSIRQSDETRLGWPTALAGAGYFFTWTVFGAVAHSIGLVLLLAGSIQSTVWKARELALCRNAPGCGSLPADTRSAWQHGLRLTDVRVVPGEGIGPNVARPI